MNGDVEVLKGGRWEFEPLLGAELVSTHFPTASERDQALAFPFPSYIHQNPTATTSETFVGVLARLV